MFLQQSLQHILFQQLALSLVGHPHGGIQADLLKMVADQIQTETVNGGDQRVVQQRHLALNML